MAGTRKTKESLSPNDQPTLRREFVTISKDGSEAVVLKTAFDRVWKERGWTVQDTKKSDQKVVATKEHS